MKYEEALRIALKLNAELEPHSFRDENTGSVRRKNELVEKNKKNKNEYNKNRMD